LNVDLITIMGKEGCYTYEIAEKENGHIVFYIYSVVNGEQHMIYKVDIDIEDLSKNSLPRIEQVKGESDSYQCISCGISFKNKEDYDKHFIHPISITESKTFCAVEYARMLEANSLHLEEVERFIHGILTGN